MNKYIQELKEELDKKKILWYNSTRKLRERSLLKAAGKASQNILEVAA